MELHFIQSLSQIPKKPFQPLLLRHFDFPTIT
jgi:hypothetical protein